MTRKREFVRSGAAARAWLGGLAAVAAAAVVACGSTDSGQKKPPAKELPAIARPMANVTDPYAAAAIVTLPPLPVTETKGLANFFRLSTEVACGGEPTGDDAWNELAAMGVKTIISVDGKIPDAARAARYGMRYVHIPVEYKGISDVELMQLCKTYRELEGPYYVHCFHGQHRGPAAAAIGRLVLDGVSREQALAEMRQRGGTAAEYPGLYRDVATKALPTGKETESYHFEFPARRQFIGFRLVMVDVPRRHDSLKRLEEHDWAADPAHPDLDAGNEATRLADDFNAAQQLADMKNRPEEFRKLLATAAGQSAKLAAAIQKAKDDPAALAESKTLFTDVTKSCTDCHVAYRNQ